MSCQHSEDVCEKCLEKEEYSPHLMTAREKRNKILFDSSILASLGVLWYVTSKWVSDIAIDIIDSILETIGAPTE